MIRTLLITATRSGAVASALINRGPTGPAGPSANVTNENVNSAISTNSSATRTALGLGNAALATTSTGGNGAADSGKVMVFRSNGEIRASKLEVVNGARELYFNPPASGIGAPTFVSGSYHVAATQSASGVPDNILPTSSKATPVDADFAVILDSAMLNVAKMLTFSNLWAWVKGKIESVALTFTAHLQATAQGTGTGDNSLMTRGLTDARYGTPYNLLLDTDWSGASLTYRSTTQNVVLPAGNYEFEGCIMSETTSATAGINSNVMPSNVSADITRGILISGNSSSLSGAGTTAGIVPRGQNNSFQYVCSAIRDGGAAGLACFGYFRGYVTFSAEQTIRFQVAHRTTTAATACVNATRYTILAVGTTNFTLIGAASNTVGLLFTATGAGTGTGTVTAPTVGSSIAVTSAVAGRSYVIDSVGTTDFTLIGAASNTVNLSFTATGPGTGTGMVSQITSAAIVKAGSFINFTKR